MSVKRRNKIGDKSRGHTVSTDMSYNESAGAMKQLGPIIGKLLIPGVSLAIARGFDSGKVLAIYNNDSAVHFYKTGPDDTITAPTNITNGAPLPPGQYTHIAMGDDKYIIADNALVYVFEVEDDSYLQ